MAKVDACKRSSRWCSSTQERLDPRTCNATDVLGSKERPPHLPLLEKGANKSAPTSTANKGRGEGVRGRQRTDNDHSLLSVQENRKALHAAVVNGKTDWCAVIAMASRELAQRRYRVWRYWDAVAKGISRLRACSSTQERSGPANVQRDLCTGQRTATRLVRFCSRRARTRARSYLDCEQGQEADRCGVRGGTRAQGRATALFPMTGEP